MKNKPKANRPKTPPAAPQNGPKTSPGEPRNKSRLVTLTPAALVLLLVSAFVLGLLTGSIFVRSSGVRQPVQEAMQAQQPAQEQPQISAEMQKRIQDLEAAAAKEPANREVLVELGNVYYDTGSYHKSIQAYEAALAINANDASVLTDCGVMYRSVGAYDKALDKFMKAQEVHPGHAVAMFNQGVVLNNDLHRHEEALKVWRQLARLHPDAAAPDGRSITDLIRQVESESKH